MGSHATVLSRKIPLDKWACLRNHWNSSQIALLTQMRADDNDFPDIFAYVHGGKAWFQEGENGKGPVDVTCEGLKLPECVPFAWFGKSGDLFE